MSIRHKQQIYKSFLLSSNQVFVAYFKKYANLLTKIKCARNVYIIRKRLITHVLPGKYCVSSFQQRKT